MNGRTELRLDWCTHEAAKYAVKHWHYSRSLPPPPMVHVGVWESSKFVGCVLFARGACRSLLSAYELSQTQGCELVRVALGPHVSQVSRIMRIAISLLKKEMPKLRLIVSFADPSQGHHGGIYQAGGWIYTGTSSDSVSYKDKNGKLWHSRMISKSGVRKVFGKYRKVLRPSDCVLINMPGKHRYLMPLDSEMRDKIALLARPYPKRVESAASGTLGIQPRGGGATPTSTLSDEEPKR